MSETKWTKGEWLVNPIGPHWNNPEIESYEICWSKEAECVVDHVYELADAHLIAAAPEMYEALEGILENYKRNDQKGLGLLPILKAQKALAKARGESCQHEK